jgi:hypothetical protein
MEAAVVVPAALQEALRSHLPSGESLSVISFRASEAMVVTADWAVPEHSAGQVGMGGTLEMEAMPVHLAHREPAATAAMVGMEILPL